MSNGLTESVFRNAAPLLSASRAAGLPKEEQSRVDGLAFLVSKNKQLKSMQPDKARSEYEKLAPDVQESLKQLFGDEDYNAEQVGALGGAWRYIRNIGEGVLDTLTNYSQIITTPYRAARVAASGPEKFFSMETWRTARDGERLFDAQREREVDAYYDPLTARIAKRIALGDDFETVLSDMKTTQEFDAFKRFMDGDEQFKQAIADYNAAKISPGRDIANLIFDVNPGEFGVERKAFNVFSGAVDLVNQVAMDPLTYIATPFKAIQAARYSTIKLVQLRADDFAGFTAKMDNLFQQQNVRQFWDDYGDALRRSTSDDKVERLQAMQDLNRIAPDMDRSVMVELRSALKETGYNAEGAREFFKQSGALEKIMMGKPGQVEPLLPRYTVTNKIRASLSKSVDRFTGYAKDDVEPETIGTFLEMLDQNALTQMDPEESARLISQIAGKRKFRDRLVRAFERAPMERFVYIGGDDVAGRSLRAQSAQTIFSLARTVMPRWHARALADAYSVTDHAGALNITYGLMRTIGDATGVTATQVGRDEFDGVVRRMFNQVYAEDMVVDDVMRAEMNLPADMEKINLSKSATGAFRGITQYHMSNRVQIPPYEDLLRILNGPKWNMTRATSVTLNNRVTESVTNHWSAMNLLPRLGIRSTIEEDLFHLTTMPLTYMKYVWQGRKASTTLRRLEGNKELGWLSRAFNAVVRPLSDDVRAMAQSSMEKQGELAEEILLKRTLTRTDPNVARYIRDEARFGNKQNLKEMSGAMSNMAYADPRNIVDAKSSAALTDSIKRAEKAAGIELKGQQGIIRKKDPSYMVNMLGQTFSRIHGNGPVGIIATKYMDNPKRAIDEIAAWMQKNPEWTSQFQLFNEQGLRRFAATQYFYVRHIFKTNTGELNTKLLNKVRKVNDKGEYVVDAYKLGMDDIDEMADILPDEVYGYIGRRWDPKDSRNSLIEDMYDVGFAVADRQVATLSREPVYKAYYIGFREKFAKAESKYVENLMKSNKNMTREAAEEIASKKYYGYASELAYNRLLGFIDNPMHRSNLAFSARNIARYYRATEDFYRRVARTTINNPQAFTRLRLMSEGLDHAGFIHEDQNGERYFFMPVDQIMYRVYAPVVRALTGEWPKQPMPLKLTGKISMLTPSLDPEASIPTLSGPMAAISISTINRMLPMEYREEFITATLGPYAENRKLYDLVMPSTVRRMIEVAKVSDPTGTSEQFISATMKAAAFYTANGMGPGPDATVEDREEFARNVQATARNIVSIRNILGIFSPVAPQVMTNADVPKHLLDVGVVSFKDSFNKLVSAEIAKSNPNAYDDALLKWTKLNPGVLVYSVSETEMNKVATVRKTRAAAEWIKENDELFKRHPQGAAFLVPAAGEFDIEAYSFMKREGFLQSKPLEDYFREIAVVNAENEYFDARREHEQKLSAAFSPSAQTAERRRWDEWSKQYRKDRPYLQFELEGAPGLQRKRDALSDLEALLEGPMAPNTATANKMREMVRVFYQADATIRSITGQTDREVEYRNYLRQVADEQLRALAGTSPNASVLYNTVIKRLLGV